jgi:NAD(P) transhydrogenase subunit alpha
MKPGSVIVDLAVSQGGNCALSEVGRTVVRHGVSIVGEPDLACTVAADASALYARNVLDFLKLLTGQDGGLLIDTSDEIVAATLQGTAAQHAAAQTRPATPAGLPTTANA